MRIVSAEIKNFRCLTERRIFLDAPLVLIIGNNGTGKTSFLEALHYACYLRSFKTSHPKEMIHSERSGFSVKLDLADTYSIETLSVQLSGAKRDVKLNQKTVSSYKELYALYRVVTMNELDLEIVQGSPSVRRNYLDQVIVLHRPEFADVFRRYKVVLDNRNALLQQAGMSIESYELWTNQLCVLSKQIQDERKNVIELLQLQINQLIQHIIGADYTIELRYQETKQYPTASIIDFIDLISKYPALQSTEIRYKRSLIGSHLDDLQINFAQKNSRAYASRGQQKLIVFLLKIAQLELLYKENKAKGVFLVDDFMADFDEIRLKSILQLIEKSATQVIITSPTCQGPLFEYAQSKNAHIEIFKEETPVS